MNYSVNNPWIAKREPIVCLWKPDYNRGFVSNMNTSLLVDVMCFSDKQMEDYALMMKALSSRQALHRCLQSRGAQSSPPHSPTVLPTPSSANSQWTP